jgi:DNA-binding MarR family transcriptional regulator
MEAGERRDLLEVVGPLHRLLRRIEDRCANEARLSMWQYSILSVAARHEALSQSAIAERLNYSKNRIIGDLDELTARGLAERRPGPDRRTHAVHATPAGRALMAEVRERIWRREDELLPHLSPESRAALLDLLGAAITPHHAPPAADPSAKADSARAEARHVVSVSEAANPGL